MGRGPASRHDDGCEILCLCIADAKLGDDRIFELAEISLVGVDAHDGDRYTFFAKPQHRIPEFKILVFVVDKYCHALSCGHNSTLLRIHQKHIPHRQQLLSHENNNSYRWERRAIAMSLI